MLNVFEFNFGKSSKSKSSNHAKSRNKFLQIQLNVPLIRNFCLGGPRKAVPLSRVLLIRDTTTYTNFFCLKRIRKFKGPKKVIPLSRVLLIRGTTYRQSTSTETGGSPPNFLITFEPLWISKWHFVWTKYLWIGISWQNFFFIDNGIPSQWRHKRPKNKNPSNFFLSF